MHKKIEPPIAPEKIKNNNTHNDIRADAYHWMRLTDSQKTNPKKDAQTLKVLSYLKSENEYYKNETKHTLDFQEKLFKELKSRIKEQDDSVPYFKNGYYYITRYEKGKQYPIYTRRKGTLESPQEILLDVNILAKGFDFYQIGGIAISKDNQKMIYGTDTLGRRQYILYLKDLKTGKVEKVVANTTGSAVWANDNQTFFYTKNHKETLRSQYVFKNDIFTKKEQLIYEEKDAEFSVFLTKTKSQKYILIGSHSTISTEYQFLLADNPQGNFQIFQKRQAHLEYDIAHYENDFFVLTNKGGATNFKLMKTPISKTSQNHWQEIIAHRPDVFLEDFTIFKDFLVLEERRKGLTQIRIKKWDGTKDFYLPFASETYTAGVYYNPEFDTKKMRYVYNAMTTPYSILDFDMETGEKTLVKEQEVLGGNFKKENYISERIWVPAKDGALIPVSIVRHKNTKFSKETPFLLYGYGAYGHTIEPDFSTTRLSLLDRGFAYGIAHIRGGQYLGREWYEKGKMKYKKNTFQDFIDCSRYLITKNYTSKNHLYAVGKSAGGLLMGVILNQASDLYKGIIAGVPFVDVLNTMLDASIPLTTGEYNEWGNPNKKDAYFYIKSYDPYENIKNTIFPNLFISAGFYDSQVQYWEPAKWIAKLRKHQKGTGKLFLYMDMKTGHSGVSGRFDALKDIAKEMSFLLDLEQKIN